MLRTGMPCERATSEWPNSCATTEANNRSVAITAVTHVATALHPGYALGKNPLASVNAKNASTRNQLGWTATSMPNRRPILKPFMVLSSQGLHLGCSTRQTRRNRGEDAEGESEARRGGRGRAVRPR